MYGFLCQALQHVMADKLYRVPEVFEKGGLVYRNRVEGDIGDFPVREIISKAGQETYWAAILGAM